MLVKPKKELDKLFQILPQRPKEQREKDVLFARFGINGKEQSLQAIGNRYHITRERVRQIQNQGIKNLHKAAKKIKIYRQIAKKVEKQAGILSLETAYKIFLPKNATKKSKTFLFLFLVANPHLRYFKETSKNNPFFTFKISPKKIKKIFQRTLSLFKKEKQALKISLAAKKLKIETKQLKEVANILKEVDIREGKIGLTSFPEINPKTTEAKIDFIFKKYQKPLHFSKIAYLIRKEKLYSKKPTEATVHNELIRHRHKYTLIGRGIYALKEWGYTEGTVKDIIAQIIKKSNRKLSREEVIAEVLKQRQVKRNTILLNLAGFRKELKA
ncbi:hypothetical protein J7K05_02535 [bacterium]|nr:hypothetical protein [bacterium]